MRFSAREAFSAARLIIASIALSVPALALAAPPDIVTTAVVRTPVPGFQTPITINLRQQGVITGTPSVRLDDPTFLTDGQSSEFVLEARVLDRTPGVCIQLFNRDFTFNPQRRYSLALVAANGDGRDAGTVDVIFSEGGGPITSPTDPACADPNRAPTAVIVGGSRTIPDSNGVPGESISFSSTGSVDPEGDRLTYQWFVNDGDAVSTAANPTLSLTDGTSRVRLIVADEAGLPSVETTVSITVNPPTTPAVDAGPDRTVPDSNGAPGETVTLTGTGSTSIVSYQWRLGSTVLGNGPSISAALPDGTNVVTLAGRLVTGAEVTDTVTIVVTAPPPRPPVADAGPDQTLGDSDRAAGESVTLDGRASTDPDGTIVSYVWTEGGTTLGTGPTLTTRLSTDGVHTIRLTVTDSQQLSAFDDVQVTVLRAPTANAGGDRSVPDTDGATGESLILSAASSTDPDGTITGYSWMIGGAQVGTAQTLTRAFVDGTTSVTLIVTDNSGLTDSTTVRITVAAPTGEPIPPEVDAGPDQSLADTDGIDGEFVTLSGTATDADGTITERVWTEGESTLGSGPSIRVRLSDGVHTVSFTATDDSGISRSDDVIITIGEATAPTADAGPAQSLADTDGQAGELVTLTGTATDLASATEVFEWFLGETSLGTGATLRTRVPDGVSTVTLRVEYNSELVATDTVQITVAAPARPPTADAGADQNLADTDAQLGELVTLTGTATDPDGASTIATYQWSNGTTVLGTTATVQTRLPDGTNTLTFTVTDSTGLSASDTVQVIIAAPVVPIVDVGLARAIADTDVEAGETVQLSGSATGSIARYEWFLGSNSLGVGQTISARLPDGVNLVTLRATNTAGAVGSGTVQITIATPVRTVLASIPGLTPNELRLAQKLDEACTAALGPLGEGAAARQESSGVSAEDAADFRQKCRGLLISRDTTALRGAMGALLGDDFAVARTQTLLFANTQYASVMDRLIALRGGAKGLSLAGLNIMVDGELIPLADLKDLAKELFGGGASSDADLWSDRWGLWARGNYSFGKKQENSLSPSFDADQYALLAGLDYRLSESAVVGAALAYGKSTVEFNPSDEGSLDTESYALSLYGSLYAKKNFYFDAIVNVADAGYQAERNITYVDGYGLISTDANGDTGGMTLSAGVSAGYDFLVGGLTISPTLGVFYIDAQIDEFTEKGAGGLNLIYDEQKFTSLTGNLGFRMTFAWNLPWGVLLPHLRADYVREFEDDVNVFGIRFAADPNAESTPPILVATENADTSYYRLAAGFSAQFRHGISGYVEYQRLESYEFISFQDISLGLRFQAAF